MKSYCLKCRKDTENINPRVSNTSNGKTMILSKCATCSNKKSRFIKIKKQFHWSIKRMKWLINFY